MWVPLGVTGLRWLWAYQSKGLGSFWVYRVSIQIPPKQPLAHCKGMALAEILHVGMGHTHLIFAVERCRRIQRPVEKSLFSSQGRASWQEYCRIT